MGLLYAKDGKIYCNEYMELYIPVSYFDENIATNKGASIETFGIFYGRSYKDGNSESIKLWKIPATVNLMVYDSRYDTIEIHGRKIDVFVLEYLKDAYVLHQTITNGREVAESFLSMLLNGKLPNILDYQSIIDLWWKNLQISGVSFKVSSKIYEIVIASIYRNPVNPKERYGQYFGKKANPSGYDYKTGNVRSVVKDLSTFSGMVFEDISTMITNGINNEINGIEEPVSPLEKIIHY